VCYQIAHLHVRDDDSNSVSKLRIIGKSGLTDDEILETTKN